MLSIQDRLAQLVQSIRDLNDEWATLRRQPQKQRLRAAASESVLAGLAHQLQLPEQEVFLNFLRLHDGWDQFEADKAILSAKELLGAGPNAIRAGKAKQAQRDARDENAASGLIVVVSHYGAYCVYLDRAAAAEGSLPVVQWDPGGPIRRHADFLAYLLAHEVSLREAVAIDRKRRH